MVSVGVAAWAGWCRSSSGAPPGPCRCGGGRGHARPAGRGPAGPPAAPGLYE